MKAENEISQSDVVIFLESQFPSSGREANITHEYAQISRQNGAMMSMLSTLLNDADGSHKARYRKTINEMMADRKKRCVKS